MGGDDEAGLLEFVTSRYPHLRRSAFLMCGDWATAGETVQEILAELVTELRRGEVDDPDGYAYAEVMTAFPRSRGRFLVASPAFVLLDALQKLAPTCRAVIVLRHWDGLQLAEIAGVLGLTGERVAAYDAAGCRALESLLGDLVAP